MELTPQQRGGNASLSRTEEAYAYRNLIGLGGTLSMLVIIFDAVRCQNCALTGKSVLRRWLLTSKISVKFCTGYSALEVVTSDSFLSVSFSK